jgi:chromosome segregation ATPase
MEIKNSQILLIESSLNELHKIINDKESKIVQLQKDKEYLKETITNNKYELESLTDEIDKLKKQIKILYDKQNELKEEIQEKDITLRSLENTKRQSEKLIQSKNNSFISSLEEKLYEANEQNKQQSILIRELKKTQDYYKHIIETNNSDLEAIQYDNNNLKKQLKSMRESFIKHEQDIKREEFQKVNKFSETQFSKSDNIMLHELEKRLMESQNGTGDDTFDQPQKGDLSEEDILKKNLGL